MDFYPCFHCGANTRIINNDYSWCPDCGTLYQVVMRTDTSGLPSGVERFTPHFYEQRQNAIRTRRAKQAVRHG